LRLFVPFALTRAFSNLEESEGIPLRGKL